MYEKAGSKLAFLAELCGFNRSIRNWGGIAQYNAFSLTFPLLNNFVRTFMPIIPFPKGFTFRSRAGSKNAAAIIVCQSNDGEIMSEANSLSFNCDLAVREIAETSAGLPVIFQW